MNKDNNDLYSKGCLIIFSSRFWGATAKLDPEQLGDLPVEIIRASRDLLVDTNKLEAVRGIIGEAKRFIKSNTIPFPIPNVDFINKNRITLVDNGLKSRKEWAKEAVEDLVDVLGQAKARYQEKFPDLYSESNYPTAGQLMDNFVFKWSFRVINPPGKDLGILSPEVYEAEIKSFKNDMKEFSDTLISVVAKELYERIDKLRDQCIGTGSISSSTVKSVHTILEKFSNVYDGCIEHEDLKKMIKDVKLYMSGTESRMLSADQDFATMVGKKMKEVVGLIVNSKDPRLTRRLDIAN